MPHGEEILHAAVLMQGSEVQDDLRHYSMPPTDAAIVLLATMLSNAGCIYLLRRLLRLTETVQSYLFPRQLYHLAIADLCMQFSSGILSCLDLLRTYVGTPERTKMIEGILCGGIDPVFRFSRNVSVLLELHIALGFAAQGRLQLSSQVAQALPWLWPLGLFIGVMEMAELQHNERNDFGLCPGRPHATWGVIILISFAFVVIVVSNTIVVLRAQAAHSPKLKGNLQRAVAYSISFIIAYLPTLAGFSPLYIANDVTETSKWFFTFEYTAESLNGLLNFLTYALQSRYAAIVSSRRSMLLRAPRLNSIASGHYHMPAEVHFGGVSVMEILPLSEAAALEVEAELAVLEDRGFNGVWVRRRASDVTDASGGCDRVIIQGTKIRWPADDNQEVVTEMEIGSQGLLGQHVRLQMCVDRVNYSADVSEAGEVLTWSDGDIWRREAPLAAARTSTASFDLVEVPEQAPVGSTPPPRANRKTGFMPGLAKKVRAEAPTAESLEDGDSSEGEKEEASQWQEM